MVPNSSFSSPESNNTSSTFKSNNYSIKQAREREERLKNELQQLDQELHEMSDKDMLNSLVDSAQSFELNERGDSKNEHSDLQQYIEIIEILREKLENTMHELAKEKKKGRRR